MPSCHDVSDNSKKFRFASEFSFAHELALRPENLRFPMRIGSLFPRVARGVSAKQKPLFNASVPVHVRIRGFT